MRAPFAIKSAAVIARSTPPMLVRITPAVRQEARRRVFSQAHAVASAAQTSYQSYPLARSPTPPRNNDIPETSIASPIPKVHETRPPAQAQQTSTGSSIPSTPTAQTAAPPSMSETEAQQSKPTPGKKQRKLRPRKAAMKLTPSAVEQLRGLLEGPDPKLIKVGVRNRGCSGLAYHLDYVDKPGAFDEEVDQDGVKVLIDSKALFSIIGSEMDYVEDKLSQRFVFRNPNIKEECGCGESFMV